MPVKTEIEIIDEGRAVAIVLPNGTKQRFHAVWLRDNAWDENTRAPGNGQRLITLGDIPVDTRISAAKSEAGLLHLTFQPENRTITFDPNWLADHGYDSNHSKASGWTGPDIKTWDASLSAGIPIGDFGAVSRSEEALRDWLYGVRRYGFGKLVGGPVESGALFKVADLFGYVRETNYGRHFEVRTEVNPSILPLPALACRRTRITPIVIRFRRCKSFIVWRTLLRAARIWSSMDFAQQNGCVRKIHEVLNC